jgi:hypothetical protein
MKRVVRPDGVMLIMEHEVPRHPVVRMLFNIRIAEMGSEDAQQFVNAGDKPYRAIFSTCALRLPRREKARCMCAENEK